MPAIVESRIPGRVPAAAIPPPASLLQWPLFGDEHLLIQAWNIHATTDATVKIAIRAFAEASQDVQYIFQQLTVPPTASGALIQIPLQRGALLSMRISSDTLPPGNVWVRAVFSKGLTPIAALTFPGTILQGYAGLSQDLAWPGSAIQLASDGPGAIRTYAGTPAAASFTFTVPANRRWKIITAYMQANADPTATNRHVDVIAGTAGGAVLFVMGSIAFQTANQSIAYSVAPGTQAQQDASTGRQLLAFPPDLPFRGGDTLQLALVTIAAGDSVSNGVITVREWYDPDTP